jgi:ribose transport system substrate-binding protein
MLSRGGTLFTKYLSVRRVACLSASICTVLLAAACSSGGSTTSSTAPTNSGSPTTSVDLPLQQPTSIGITTPLSKPIPKGRTIAVTLCAYPACTAEIPTLDRAAAATGTKLKVFTLGSTPSAVAAGYNSIVALKPAAVIEASGLPRELYNKQLTELAADHIPVIAGSDAQEPGNGLTSIVTGISFYQQVGKILAQYTVHQNRHLNAVYVSIPTYATATYIGQTYTSEVSALCSTCKVTTFAAPASSLGSNLQSLIVAWLQSHPGINEIVSFDDQTNLGLDQALTSAGYSGKIKSATMITSASGPAISDLRSGAYLTGGVVWAGPYYLWRAFDEIFRIWGGQSTAPDQAPVPQWVVTKATLPATAAITDLVPDYQEQFLKLWGVK